MSQAAAQQPSRKKAVISLLVLLALTCIIVFTFKDHWAEITAALAQLSVWQVLAVLAVGISYPLLEGCVAWVIVRSRLPQFTLRQGLDVGWCGTFGNVVTLGAGAVPVAAALFHKLPIEGKKVVCLISGGNIDVNILSRVITRGMVMSGRKTNLMIALEDKPGQLSLVSDIVSACGANVVSVHHDRSDANMAITSCFLKLGLETRDAAQIEQIKQKLTEAGFKLVTERA